MEKKLKYLHIPDEERNLMAISHLEIQTFSHNSF